MVAFTVSSHSTLVGTSELESGDAPMGIAFGRFLPLEGYAAIRSRCSSTCGAQQAPDLSGLNLSVRTAAGSVVECVAVTIIDCSTELGPEGIELSVLGIPYPLYGQLFPRHVAAYENQFR
jgi:hypothetical protein